MDFSTRNEKKKHRCNAILLRGAFALRTKIRTFVLPCKYSVLHCIYANGKTLSKLAFFFKWAKLNSVNTIRQTKCCKIQIICRKCKFQTIFKCTNGFHKRKIEIYFLTRTPTHTEWKRQTDKANEIKIGLKFQLSNGWKCSINNSL